MKKNISLLLVLIFLFTAVNCKYAYADEIHTGTMLDNDTVSNSKTDYDEDISNEPELETNQTEVEPDDSALQTEQNQPEKDNMEETQNEPSSLDEPDGETSEQHQSKESVEADVKKPTVSSLPNNYKTNYTCSFELTLDSSFKSSWVYNISENGKLHVTLQYLSANKNNYEVVLTLEGSKKIQLLECRDIRRTYDFGMYYFNGKYKVLEDDGFYYTYDDLYRGVNDGYYDALAIKLYKEKKETTVQFYLQQAQWTGTVNSPVWSGWEIVSSIINIDEKDLTLKGEKQGLLFFIDEENPVNPNAWPPDPRLYREPEKTIEAHGNYRDEDGTIHPVATIKGVQGGERFDNEVTITAQFQATARNSMWSEQLSTDDQLTFTYLNLKMFIDGEYVDDKQMLKISGNKGGKWFLGGATEINKANPAVEIIQGSKLVDDSSIYMEFIPLDKFENNVYEYTSPPQDTISFLFKFDDSTKKIMRAIDIDLAGRKISVPISDVDYTGGLLGYFLKLVYPDNYMSLGKELGIL